MSLSNPYLPDLATIQEVIEETPAIRTFRVSLNDTEKMNKFKFKPGQIGQLSLFGIGESTFVINSPPAQKEYLQFSVMSAGEVTKRIHQLYVGDEVGIRAPLGNSFPVEDMKGHNILIIGGGIGMAPLRTLLLYLLDNKENYQEIKVVYGARTPEDFCYKYEFEDWVKKGAELLLTIDREYKGWKGRVGLVPHVLEAEKPNPQNSIAIICGPPIMIKFVLQSLKKLGYEDNQIITTLEKRMKCGIGLCGRCNIGNKYVCIDGPIFSYDQLKQMVPEI